MKVGDLLSSEWDRFVSTEPVPAAAWQAAGLHGRADVSTIADLTVGELEAFVIRIPNPTTDDGKGFISSCRLLLQGLYVDCGHQCQNEAVIWPAVTTEENPAKVDNKRAVFTFSRSKAK